MKPMQSNSWSSSSLDAAMGIVSDRANAMKSDPFPSEQQKMKQELAVPRMCLVVIFLFFFRVVLSGYLNII